MVRYNISMKKILSKKIIIIGSVLLVVGIGTVTTEALQSSHLTNKVGSTIVLTTEKTPVKQAENSSQTTSTAPTTIPTQNTAPSTQTTLSPTSSCSTDCTTYSPDAVTNIPQTLLSFSGTTNSIVPTFTVPTTDSYFVNISYTDTEDQSVVLEAVDSTSTQSTELPQVGSASFSVEFAGYANEPVQLSFPNGITSYQLTITVNEPAQYTVWNPQG